MAENFSFDFLKGSGLPSGRGLTDPPFVAPEPEPEGLSAVEMIDILFGVMMERFDALEAKIDALGKSDE